jgi:chromosome segregation ATPase
MINLLAVPSALLDELRALADAVGRLPGIDETIDGRLADLDARLERLPGDIEQALRPHFEQQHRGLEVMEGHLAANREAAEQLPPRIDRLLERIDAMRDELRANREAAEALPSRLDSMSEDLRAIRGEITSVRETLEPLQGPAERLARMDERLPGGR